MVSLAQLIMQTSGSFENPLKPGAIVPASSNEPPSFLGQQYVANASNVLNQTPTLNLPSSNTNMSLSSLHD